MSVLHPLLQQLELSLILGLEGIKFLICLLILSSFQGMSPFMNLFFLTKLPFLIPLHLLNFIFLCLVLLLFPLMILFLLLLILLLQLLFLLIWKTPFFKSIMSLMMIFCMMFLLSLQSLLMIPFPLDNPLELTKGLPIFKITIVTWLFRLPLLLFSNQVLLTPCLLTFHIIPSLLPIKPFVVLYLPLLNLPTIIKKLLTLNGRMQWLLK